MSRCVLADTKEYNLENSREEACWALSPQEVLDRFKVSKERGLSAEEVQERRKKYGSNRLPDSRTKSVWVIILDQFKSLIILLLVAAAVVSYVFGDLLEGIAIAVVIGINTAIGFFTELKAVRSMEALKRMGSVGSRVRRDNEIVEISAEEIVPGDIMIIEGGDIVTADARLVEASRLQVDESTLTGESVPVGKGSRPVDRDTELAERKNMLFKGTAITRGSGEGVVVSTGTQTELGKISSLVESAEEETTPLEQRLNTLGRKLIWVTLIIVILIAGGGILAGKEIFLMIETSIALAVAAIPEGLPIVATLALARVMWRMARRNALINRLSAVETLGATSVIFADKTGTLTENRMTVKQIVVSSSMVEIKQDNGVSGFFTDEKRVHPDDDPLLSEALKIGILCNNASFLYSEEKEDKVSGDPLEVALLAVGAQADMKRQEVVKDMPEVREEAFDPEIRMMATVHKKNDYFYVAVKGAPEAVLEKCDSILTKNGAEPLKEKARQEWLDSNERMAEKGQRMLAVARKNTNEKDVNPYEKLTFVGLVGLLDPPRQEIKNALSECRKAGIRVIMVTGDQPVTAWSIARAVDLVQNSGAEVVLGRDLKPPDQLREEQKKHLLSIPIFARVNPEQKLNLIGIHQDNGSIVAMTGDGVNDAPALKKADIGVAMGKRGTQVAREAADMVLKDDAFATIVAAIEQGRVIFANIRKFVLYLMSCNVSEIMSVALASVVNMPLPILPLQILFLNLITDVFPALALGMGEGDPMAMNKPPRPSDEPILRARHWYMISSYGFLITAAVIGSLMVALHLLQMENEQAVTVSFLTLAFAQLCHVFNMRESGSRLLHNDITGNKYVWGALGLCTVLLLIAVYTPGLSFALHVVDPGLAGWFLVLGASMFPLVIGQIATSLKIPVIGKGL